MKQVSELFKNKSLSQIKDNLLCKITYYDLNNNLVEINENGDLIEVNYIAESDITGVSVSSAIVTLKNYYNLNGNIINISYGYMLEDESSEYILLGEFKVFEQEYKEDIKETVLTCYDMLIETNKEIESYETLIPLPATIKDIAYSLIDNLGLEHDSSFDNELYVVEKNYYENAIFTYREILEDIAEVCNGIIVVKDKKISLVKRNVTNINLDESILLRYQESILIGPINSLIIINEAQEDIIYLRDEEAIEVNGLQEIKFINNKIIGDKGRDIIDSLLLEYKELNWKPFIAETIGIGIFDLNDTFNITLNNITKEHIILGISLTINNGISETIYFEKTEKQTEDYVTSTENERRLITAEIRIDKQEGQIQSLVSSGDEVKQQISELNQTIEGFDFQNQKIGGMNLIKNSAGWNDLEFWNSLNANTIQSVNISDSTLSKSAFFVQDGYLKQNVSLPTLYASDYLLSFRVKCDVGKTIIYFYNGDIAAVPNYFENNLILNYDGKMENTYWDTIDSAIDNYSDTEVVEKSITGNALLFSSETLNSKAIQLVTLQVGKKYIVEFKVKNSYTTNAKISINYNDTTLTLYESADADAYWHTSQFIFDAINDSFNFIVENSNYSYVNESDELIEEDGELLISDLVLREYIEENEKNTTLLYYRNNTTHSNEFDYIVSKVTSNNQISTFSCENTSDGLLNSEGLYLTDIMLVGGNQEKEWEPNRNELYSANVLIDENGLKIKNSISNIETRITNQEFSVYHDSIKALSVNKDLTTLKETEIKDNLTIGNTIIFNKEDGIDIVVIEE